MFPFIFIPSLYLYCDTHVHTTDVGELDFKCGWPSPGSYLDVMFP